MSLSMDRVVDAMHPVGTKIILGTPNYSIPPWMHRLTTIGSPRSMRSRSAGHRCTSSRPITSRLGLMFVDSVHAQPSCGRRDRVSLQLEETQGFGNDGGSLVRPA